MKRLSKVSCGLLLTASLLIGAMLSGCGQTTDYTAEIREYQNKLESLAAENEELKAQLGITETQSTEENQTAAETENQSQEMVSENQTTETDVQQAENTDNSGDEMKILVLGDSIWGNYRDDTGVSARLAACLAQEGKNATVYNGAIGGTRATISPDDNEYQFGPASDCSLGKMVSILRGDTDVEMLQGKAAYDDIKAVMDVKDQIDVVILSYGMNDFLAQAPINNSDRPWTGFGTVLRDRSAGSIYEHPVLHVYSDDLLRSYRVSAEHECNRSESVYVRRSILWYQRSTGDAYELCSRWWRCEGSQRSTEEECSNRREIIRFSETKNI